jgi:hypothetical protein
MTEPGTPTGRPSQAVRGLLAALVGFALLAAGILVGAVPAAAGNRVGASTPVMINTVGSSPDIGPGQRLGKTVPQPQIVVATGVAAEGVSVSAGQGVDRAAGSLVRSVGGHESPDALFSELRQLTYESGNEHALVRMSSGEFQIHAGGATGIDLSSDISQVIAHTHPYGLDALGPSADDVGMLGHLGQGASILLEHGQTILFGPEGTIAWR